MLMHK